MPCGIRAVRSMWGSEMSFSMAFRSCSKRSMLWSHALSSGGASVFGHSRRETSFPGIGIAAEIEDVPLRDAQVLQKLPGSVRRAFRFDAAQRGGKCADSLFVIEMRSLHAQQVEQMFADWVGTRHLSSLPSVVGNG